MADPQKEEYQLGILIDALQEEEVKLTKANQDLAEAQVRFDISSRRFAVLRDLSLKQFNRWPFGGTPDPVINPLQGFFRFIHMEIGDGVMAVLREANKPLALPEIVRVLAEGGFRPDGLVSPRAVNAALMNLSGVTKSKDGTYEAVGEPESVMPDDLPV